MADCQQISTNKSLPHCTIDDYHSYSKSLRTDELEASADDNTATTPITPNTTDTAQIVGEKRRNLVAAEKSAYKQWIADNPSEKDAVG